MKSLRIAVLLVLSLWLWSCDEKLPPRVEPANTLAITRVIYTQGMYDASAFMEFVVQITNRYTETFQDKVNVVGQVRIWLKRDPSVRATVAIRNYHLVAPSKITGDVLTIDPGGRCDLKMYWYLILDDGRNVLDLLDYSAGVEWEGLINAKPEVFVMEADIKLFSQTGYLYSDRLEITFTGTRKVGGPRR